MSAPPRALMGKLRGLEAEVRRLEGENERLRCSPAGGGAAAGEEEVERLRAALDEAARQRVDAANAAEAAEVELTAARRRLRGLSAEVERRGGAVQALQAENERLRAAPSPPRRRTLAVREAASSDSGDNPFSAEGGRSGGGGGDNPFSAEGELRRRVETLEAQRPVLMGENRRLAAEVEELRGAAAGAAAAAERVAGLEAENSALAERLLRRQAASAAEVAHLEEENEGLRAYTDQLMAQLLQARMDETRG